VNITTDQLRNTFLEFFKSKGHTIVPSDSLVPRDDPTLLFTGAGMNQFKEKFLGRNVTYRRAASSQKCLRTGDLENVGKTSGHHTFFEMLGNFSFGDYFKKEAIQWAWEFLVDRLQLTVDRLWVSVYRDDDEAYNIWKDSIKVPVEKILKFGEKENFWPSFDTSAGSVSSRATCGERSRTKSRDDKSSGQALSGVEGPSGAPTKGPNGPCGPCSEVFYDYGKDVGCRKAVCTPACGCGRFVEVWNMVFTQFDRQADGTLEPLPAKNIDTGMGLERLASVMQGVHTNFEIDIFVPIIKAAESFCVLRPASSANAERRTPNAERINAIADHIRAVTFCVGDGVMPSNEERGYVVRKLVRRAASHGRDIGIKEPFLYKLVSTVSDLMGKAYPELKERRDDIAQVVKREEENFLNVLETQLPKVDEAFEKFKRSEGGARLAEAAFNFYDTYGMPYEMLEEIAERHGLKIDKGEFEKLLERQRQQSRAKTKIKGEIFSETFAKKVEALGLKTEFLGYEKAHAAAKVLDVLEGGEVILDRTPFYGESGGQAGDWGKIETRSGAMEVEDAKKIGETIVHIGRVLSGKIVKGETAEVSIDEEVRRKVMANHTATHLLQAALRKVLGDHVKQTGSLVDAEHLRFDFTHMRKMEGREIARVEEVVNENIKKGIAVKKEIKDIETARKEGAIALFGEKYGQDVRVVSVGDVSKELCGGTHADNTKDIGIFRITSESSIASGVRRIEALTGAAAEEWIAKQKEAESRKLRAESQKEEERKRMEKRLKDILQDIDSLITKAKTAGSVKVITEIIDNMDMDSLRKLSDRIRQAEKSSIIILAAITGEKASFIVSVPEDAVKKNISAGAIAKELAGMIDGSGGGKPNFAQGGGKAPAKLKGAMLKIVDDLKARLR
jgi:alanyl-tRNA synthetase